MKKIVLILAALLAVSMILCACGETAPAQTGGNTETTAPNANVTVPETTEPVATETQPLDFVYTVKVVDADGAPMPGVFVQICAGTTCVPVATDANGIAGYVNEVTGDGELAAKIITIPAGYAAVDDITEISMADGKTDVVFTLEPVA